jgi:acetylornithine deacetylase
VRRLVNIYSPSGKEEEILDFLHGYLKKHGLPVVEQAVDGNRYNLIVMPPDVQANVVLIGHIDTAVAYDLDHYGYQDQEDAVSGLGTADMKAGCAAMIEAFLTLREGGNPWAPAALALVVGEEEEGDGAKKLAREFHFPWALIGEPTDLQPCMSHYGYLEVQVSTYGKRMHASLANLGQHPIEAMLRFLLKVSHYVENVRSEIVYNIRELSSSHAGFAVPERCDAWLDFHLPPSAPLGEITMEIEEIFAQEQRSNPEFNGALRFTTIHGGYELPEKGPIVDTLKAVYERRSLAWEPHAFRSHSDANLLWAAGVKPILLGPGQLERAHAPDEGISFQQVILAAEVYLDLLTSLCS